MTLHSLGQSTSVQVSPKTSTVPKKKAARMEEWSQLPLRGRTDMERWLTVMSDQFTTEPPRDAAPENPGRGPMIPVTSNHRKKRNLGVEPQSEQGSNAWQFRDSRVGTESSYGPHQPHPETMGSSIYVGHSAGEESEVLQSPSAGSSRHGMIGVNNVGDSVGANTFAAGAETGRSSKADELSEKNPSLYF